jgi:hypothetical protein
LYAELLPLDYNIEEENVDLLEVAKFVPQSGLITHKNTEIGDIERLLELPSHIRKSGLEELRNQNKNSNKKRNILDILRPILGSSIPPQINLDKEFFLKMVESEGGRKRQTDRLNLAIASGR